MEDERADCSFFKPIKTEAQTLALILISCITFFLFKIYFKAALGLCCCAWAFSRWLQTGATLHCDA